MGLSSYISPYNEIYRLRIAVSTAFSDSAPLAPACQPYIPQPSRCPKGGITPLASTRHGMGHGDHVARKPTGGGGLQPWHAGHALAAAGGNAASPDHQPTPPGRSTGRVRPRAGVELAGGGAAVATRWPWSTLAVGRRNTGPICSGASRRKIATTIGWAGRWMPSSARDIRSLLRWRLPGSSSAGLGTHQTEKPTAVVVYG